VVKWDKPRFGPAGMPAGFRQLKRKVFDMPQYLSEEGLNAFEYQAVRWGAKPQISREEAEKLGVNAEKFDVLLSVHGSYFINFCGKEETIEASKRRLVACVTAASWMKAHTLVFHPGFYGKHSPKEAFEKCVKALKQVIEELQGLGIKIKLGPETMGKPSQFGSLEEVLGVCERLENAIPVIDWAHLHARSCGRFKTKEDFMKVLDEIGKRLGEDVLKRLHCHFTKVEYTDKGEKCHHTMDEAAFGPNFRLLAKAFVEYDLNPVIISESPILDVDAIKMRDILLRELETKGV